MHRFVSLIETRCTKPVPHGLPKRIRSSWHDFGLNVRQRDKDQQLASRTDKIGAMNYKKTVLTVWVTEYGWNSIPTGRKPGDVAINPERSCYGIYTSWEEASLIRDSLNARLSESEDAEVRNFRASIREEYRGQDDRPPAKARFKSRMDVCEQFGLIHFN